MAIATGRGPGIFYELKGNPDGPALVLVRGLGRFALHWGPFLDLLAPDFQLLVLDNRGLGRSGAAHLPFTASTMADDLARVLDHAQIARAHVFGISLGGMVALRFALDHGGRLDRLVLAATTPGGARSVRPRLGPFVAMARARMASVPQAITVEASLMLGSRFVAENPAILATWRTLARDYPTAPRTLLFQALAALVHDVERDLDRIGAPTLVISAEADRLVPPENSRLLARRLPRARLEWLPGDAHDLTTEHADAVAALLRAFLLAPLDAV
ncbi:MAG: alpha/beta fold hydrolase [Myxococcales bacterium]|nr:alpha/beta fold hydrolase [Myxococcales bacterium]